MGDDRLVDLGNLPLARAISVGVLVLAIVVIGALFFRVMANFFVPLFLAARALSLFDTIPGLVIAYIGFNLSFAVWLSLSFFRQMPHEVLEAARVDGASWLQVLTRVAVPLNRGGIATVAVFTAIFSWNELLLPLFLTSGRAKTFTVVLTEFQGQTNTVWEQMAAGAAIQVLPIVILTFFVQRTIVAGITMGAVK